jgi:CRP/FNR family transcriptional regulator
MYFIVRGTVRITKGPQPLAELKERDFFGEMSVFDGETRSATATAAGEVVLLSLSRHDLFEVMEDQPEIGIGICQTLVRRIRNLLEERAQAWRRQETPGS